MKLSVGSLASSKIKKYCSLMQKQGRVGVVSNFEAERLNPTIAVMNQDYNMPKTS